MQITLKLRITAEQRLRGSVDEHIEVMGDGNYPLAIQGGRAVAPRSGNTRSAVLFNASRTESLCAHETIVKVRDLGTLPLDCHRQ